MSFTPHLSYRRLRSRSKPKSRSGQFGPATPTPTPTPTPAPTPLPPLSAQVQWSPRLETLGELLRAHPLPLLAQCRARVLRSHDDRPFPLSLDKPVLLADRRTARQLLARVVDFDERSRTFTESADTVVIPEDYEGHFLRLHCRTTKDKSHVQSLETIAQNDAAAFLSLSDITSFPAGPRDPHDQSKMIYTVGNVFLIDEPLPSEASRRPRPKSAGSDDSRNSSGTFGCSRSSGDGLMRCLDERGVAVVVPTDQAGEVVAVKKNGDQRPRLSVKSRELTTAGEQFPVLVRYIYGRRQPRLTPFSKLFTLLDCLAETTVIACIIDGPSVTLLELPVTSSLQFQAALHSEDLMKLPRMRKAWHVCCTRGRELARDVKFKLKFSHRVQETSQKMAEGGTTCSIRARLVVTDTYVYI